MSQRKEKYLRKALKQYDSIVESVGESERRSSLAELRSERALDIVMGQASYSANERAAVERRMRKEVRKERGERRKTGRVAAWALAVAVVDLFAMVGLAVAVLL